MEGNVDSPPRQLAWRGAARRSVWPLAAAARVGLHSALVSARTYARCVGLGSGVWTQSINRGLTMAKKIRAGTVWVNTYRAVSFTMPFGGYKSSGLGRENGQDAINEYLHTKSVWVNTATGSGGNPFIMKTSSS